MTSGTPTPTPFQLNIQMNSTFSLPCQYLDSNSNPINLTGYKFSLQIQSQQNPAQNFLCTSGNNRIVITNAAAGQFSITISAHDTQLLAAFTSTAQDSSGNWLPLAVYNCLAMDGSGVVTPIMAGPVAVLPPIAPIPS